MERRINKKSFVFSMDAFFAIVLFLIVTLGIYSYFINFYSLQQQWYMSEDMMNMMSDIKIGEIDKITNIYPNIQRLYGPSPPGILDDELTIAKQIDKLFKEGKEEDAQLLAEDLINPLRGSRFGVVITIEDVVDSTKFSEIYNSTITDITNNRLGKATSQRYITK